MKTARIRKREEIAAARTLVNSVSEQALQRISTGRVRYALSKLAQNNVTRVQEWLDAVALVDGPKAALELYLKMIEYSVPKLSRTEVKVEDAAGNTATAQLSMEDLQDLIRKGVALHSSVVATQEPEEEDEPEDEPEADEEFYEE